MALLRSCRGTKYRIETSQAMPAQDGLGRCRTKTYGRPPGHMIQNLPEVEFRGRERGSVAFRMAH